VDSWTKLEEFMSDEIHTKELDYEYGPMRLLLIPDFVDNMSVLIFVGTHSYTDGVGVISTFESWTI
jgi:hypothetical protein